VSRLNERVPLGASVADDGRARFLVWAPAHRAVRLVVASPARRSIALDDLGGGYFGTEAEDVPAGSRYGFRLDGGPVLPDPASRSQPDGVEGLSEVVAPERFDWGMSEWEGRPLERLVFYELHVGTFSREGTFGGVIPQLERLRSLGVTAIELLPVAQFPGRRNWGYDGVYPFAVQHSYGGIEGLQGLSRRCHEHGLALFLDVVYNHLGPEGNHLGRFGPYFTDRYRTPWGAALNYDGSGSDEVRRFFVESATWLARMARLDGFRVDAVHAFVDPTAQPFLSELTRAVHAVGADSGVSRWLVAESALNDPRVVWPEEAGGLGFDAMWNDDFHHALRVALTGEQLGYFQDFGGVPDLRRTLVHGFSLAGRYSPFRGRRHGRPAGEIGAERLVVFCQNHDQVGNRPFGDRLGSLVSFEAEKLAAGITLLSPFLPLLFMGSEYGERAPFLYFTDHSGRRLARAVRAGRAAELRDQSGGREPPDPQSPRTFLRSRLGSGRIRSERRAVILARLHGRLLELRSELIPVRRLKEAEVGQDRRDPLVLWIHRRPSASTPGSLGMFRFAGTPARVSPPRLVSPVRLRLASAARDWDGPGSRVPNRIVPGRPASIVLTPWSFVFYAEEGLRAGS
jgi:maltooligosyltrehalose trehalohydrolase